MAPLCSEMVTFRARVEIDLKGVGGMAWAPDAPQGPILRSKSFVVRHCGLPPVVPPSVRRRIQPAERGPGGGLTATYCTQLGMMLKSNPSYIKCSFLQ